MLLPAGSIDTQNPQATGGNQPLRLVYDVALPELSAPARMQGYGSSAQPAFSYRPYEARVILDPDHHLPLGRREQSTHRTACLDDAGVHAPMDDALRLKLALVDGPLDHDLLPRHDQQLETQPLGPAPARGCPKGGRQ